MMMQARLGIAMERGSIFWGTALVGLLCVVMLVTAVGLTLVVGDSGCDADFSRPGCRALVSAWAPWESTAHMFIGLLWVIPTGLGSLLGVAITAGEIERRTAGISWSLARDRTRWPLLRATPVALVLVLVLAVAAAVAELTGRSRLMTDDLGLFDYQLRSLLVPARGLVAFGVGLAFGALIGRALPALLVALAFSAAITAGLLLLMDAWHMASATFVPFDAASRESATHPLIAGSGGGVSGPGGEEGYFMIPASEFWVWVSLEGAVLVLTAAIVGVLAIQVIRRTSP